jgi:phosphoribosylanthranilate isomerase
MAEEAGADAIGVVVFSPSPRRVDPRQVPAIFEAAPSLTRCCVAHEPTPDEIKAMCSLRPDAIQVFCTVPMPGDRCAQVIRSIRQGDPIPADADALVVDASQGRGQLYDPVYAASVVRSTATPVFLAGGLSPGNVRDAIAAVHPYGVDVATGVEYAPGRKDARKVQAFVKNARGGMIYD